MTSITFTSQSIGESSNRSEGASEISAGVGEGVDGFIGSQPTFDTLPDELQQHILSFLPISELSRTALVSKNIGENTSVVRGRWLNRNGGKVSALNISVKALEDLLHNHGKNLQFLTLTRLSSETALTLTGLCLHVRQ